MTRAVDIRLALVEVLYFGRLSRSLVFLDTVNVKALEHNAHMSVYRYMNNIAHGRPLLTRTDLHSLTVLATPSPLHLASYMRCAHLRVASTRCVLFVLGMQWLEGAGFLRCSSTGLDNAAEGNHVNVLQVGLKCWHAVSFPRGGCES